MIKSVENIRVGDKVKWYGRSYELKEGKTRKMMGDKFKKLEDEIGLYNINMPELRKEFFKPIVYRRGTATIAEIYRDLPEIGKIVTLSNGIEFVLEKNNIRIKKTI